MEAYKKYGVVKGTVLTAWRLCRCNPLGIYQPISPCLFLEKNEKEKWGKKNHVLYKKICCL
jgi:putative component of membrane protein insertase Oxa1/YidC/SpoIIIJ protein YidD